MIDTKPIEKLRDTKPNTIARSKEFEPPLAHRFSQRQIHALIAALATERPLIVSGEPGIGKSQLATAAAIALERSLIPFVIDHRTEAQDLRWHFDPIARLAEAQLCQAENAQWEARRRVDLRNFVAPGPFWWAFDVQNAAQQAAMCNGEPGEFLGEDRNPTSGLENVEPVAQMPQRVRFPENHGNGWVVLIDEIDKAAGRPVASARRSLASVGGSGVADGVSGLVSRPAAGPRLSND